MENRPDPLRYQRHLALPEFGAQGQRRLRAAAVLIVGAGGLGSPAAMYLAAAGVGRLGLVDFDEVDESNLQRQILYSTPDVGRSKIAVAIERLSALNPDVTVVPHETRITAQNARALVAPYDIVLDGTDNFAARYLVNDACVLTRTPNVYGSISRFDGQVAVFAAPGGPCYRCLHPQPPPPGLIQNCADAGVLGVLPGVVGTLQATEAIKMIAGIGEPLVGRLLLYDALRMRFREISLPRDRDCPVCGDAPTILEPVQYEEACEPDAIAQITAAELHRWRTAGTPHTLVDVREPSEHATANIPGAILIPLGELASHQSLLPTDRPVVVHCRSGGRSSRAVEQLRRGGIDARNLTGGIAAWLRRQPALTDK